MDISAPTQVSVWDPNILFEESASQNSDLGRSSHDTSKKRVTLGALIRQLYHLSLYTHTQKNFISILN